MLGYTSWHQLFVYSCISCILSADLFVLLLFSYLLFSALNLLLFCTHCLYARALFLMRSLGRFLTILNLHVQILNILFYWLGVRWDWTYCEELEFLPFWFWYSCLYFDILSSFLFLFLYFPWFLYIRFSLCSSSFIWYHAWMLICDIAVMVDLLWFRFITCFGLLKA